METCAGEGVRYRSIKVFSVDKFPVINPWGQRLRVCWWYQENEPCLANIAMKSTHGICRLTLRRITYEPRSDVYGVTRRERHNIGELGRVHIQAVRLEVGDASKCVQSIQQADGRKTTLGLALNILSPFCTKDWLRNGIGADRGAIEPIIDLVRGG